VSKDYEWKIRVAKSYKDLEKMVELIQEEGWTIDKIDVASVSVVAYRPKKQRLDENKDWGDNDYGQQEIG
tara:strand:+ start:754 stop:963 length:210 start_codon:yes stop_codon:yes gene_type:complete